MLYKCSFKLIASKIHEIESQEKSADRGPK